MRDFKNRRMMKIWKRRNKSLVKRIARLDNKISWKHIRNNKIKSWIYNNINNNNSSSLLILISGKIKENAIILFV